MNTNVDAYFSNLKNWQQELHALRSIVLSTHLTETLKWENPCYTINNKNVLMLGTLKSCCFISFFKGSLLKDTAGILYKQGEHSQTGRIIKFTETAAIVKMETTLKAYIQEAIEVEQLGLPIKTTSNATLILPEELIHIFKNDIAFEKAFKALSPGRQRGYCIFFMAAKQPATRITRIEKYRNRIFEGKGMNDCTCGLSKRMPICDGSHNSLKQ